MRKGKVRWHKPQRMQKRNASAPPTPRLALWEMGYRRRTQESVWDMERKFQRNKYPQNERERSLTLVKKPRG